MRKFLNVFRRRALEADMQAEMRQHLEEQARRNQAAGMNAREARDAAQRQFGNLASIQERSREVRVWVWLEQLLQDLGYAVRGMIKAPGFAGTVVATLGMGIGACTVVFTAINSTLLRPLAGEPVDREVIIHETLLPQRPQMQLSPPMFLDLERNARSYEYISAWQSVSYTIQTDVEPLQLRGAAISQAVLLGWNSPPALGRAFTQEEFEQGERVVMLGHSLWQRAFGGAKGITERSVTLDGEAYRVVGVISPRFARYGSDLEYFIPLTLRDQRPQARTQRWLQVTAKLKRGVALAQAQAELDLLAANIARQYPDTNRGVGLLVRDLGAYINRSLSPMLKILLGAVACVLLIACANVANLLLARATARQREVSLRMALGAGRGRLIRQFLVESILLALTGGGLGVLLAQWGLRFVRAYGPAAGTDMARLAYIELDPAVLAFTLGFSVLTGIVFGLAPAWLGSRVDVNEVLKQGGRGSSEPGLRGGLQRMLVVTEVALALVLLAAAGLLVRGFARLAETDPGFTTARVATMQLILNARKYPQPAARQRFGEQLLEKVRGLPGVERAALANVTPFQTPGMMSFVIAGRPETANRPAAIPYLVTPEYFRAMGIRLIRGRTFDSGSEGPAEPVFVINETLARMCFPDSDPLGQRIVTMFGDNPGPSGEIIGIVADVMQGMPGETVPPQFYFPWQLLPGGGINLMVRTADEPAALLPLLKARMHELDPLQPVALARPLQGLMDDKLARLRFMLVLLCIYGGIALLVAAVGIYAVMAYAVSQRTVEFGIRMALGASRGDVLGQVLRQGMIVVGIGLVIGMAVVVGLGVLTRAVTFHAAIDSNDPATLAFITFVMAAVALVACWLPARRATKVDPMVALRAE